MLPQAGRATLELFDEAQAETVDAIEAGRHVSGTVRLALRVADSEQTARRLVAAEAEQVAPPVTTPWATATHASGRRTGCSSPCSPASSRTSDGRRHEGGPAVRLGGSQPPVAEKCM